VSGWFSDSVREAITQRSLYGASQSFGVVVLVVLIILLLEQAAFSQVRSASLPRALLSAVTIPLLAVFFVVVGARFAELLP
jgi:hypothetical protein